MRKVLGVLAAALLLVALCGAASAASVRVNVHVVGSGTVIDDAAFYHGDERPYVYAHTVTFGKNMDYRLSEYLNVDELKGSKSISVAADYLDFEATIGLFGGETGIGVAKARDAQLTYAAYGSHGDMKFSRSVSLTASKVENVMAFESNTHMFNAVGKLFDVSFRESFTADIGNGKIFGSTRLDVPAADRAKFVGSMSDVVTVPYELSDVSVSVNVNSLSEDNTVSVSYVNEDEFVEIVTTTLDGKFAGIENAPFFYESFSIQFPSE